MPTRQRTSGEYLSMLARELRDPLGPIRSIYSGRCRATSNIVHELRSADRSFMRPLLDRNVGNVEAEVCGPEDFQPGRLAPDLRRGETEDRHELPTLEIRIGDGRPCAGVDDCDQIRWRHVDLIVAPGNDVFVLELDPVTTCGESAAA